MPIELYIWGPAFGLPSIDPECLASIAYLRNTLQPGEWVLIAACDPAVTFKDNLPVLKDGGTLICGFTKIVEYLRKRSAGKWDLNKYLEEPQVADSVAFSSFLESRGRPLLDLSLYVSSENYTTCTRGALADILSWPAQWINPPKLRTEAKKRSDHLGLSSLDLNNAHDEPPDDGRLTAQIPKSLRKPKRTLSSLLGKGTHRSQFRLDAATSAFFEPLNDLLGKRAWFISDKLCSLDCMAIGYLALMKSPILPQDWLRNALKDKYPSLSRWVEKTTRQCFGPPIQASEIMLATSFKRSTKSHETLLWQPPLRPAAVEIASATMESFLEFLPITGEALNDRTSKPLSTVRGEDKRNGKALMRLRGEQKYRQLTSVAIGIAALVSGLLWAGYLPFYRRQPVRIRRDFGAAGAMLGLG